MKRLFSIASSLFVCTVLIAGEIFVSPAGDDSNPGTHDKPVRSLCQALRIAREWRRTQDSRAIEDIYIRLESSSTFILNEPVYIRPEDSGTLSSKTVITTDGDESSTISGGITCEPSASVFMPPRLSGRPVLTRCLWVGGTKWQLSSHRGKYMMDRILSFDAQNESITIPAKALTDYGIKSIEDAPQLEMIVHQRWAIAVLRVKAIDIYGDKAVLTFCNPESRWEFSHPWPQPVIGGEYGSSSFSLRNARQFLDDENEWWQDYSDGRIYSKKGIDGHEVVLPTINRLVTIDGTCGDRVHDIIFKNITFSYTSCERPSYYGHVTLQGGFPIIDAYKLKEHEGLPWAYGLENQAWITRPETAVSVSWAERVDFIGCQFEHLSSTALDYTVGCSDIKICNNVFTDIGGTAVLCGSFAEGPTEVHRPYGMNNAGIKDGNTLQKTYTERFLISGNKVTDATNEDWGCVGIGCGYVRDFKIIDNIVSDVNYSGIAIGWGWTTHDTGMRNNIIARNKVYGYARMLYDAGGIYTMSAQPGSIIEDNVVSAPYQAPYATNRRAFPIYFDACTDGFTVRRNNLSVSHYTPERYGFNAPGPNMNIE